MMRLPVCDICEERIETTHRYNLGNGVYICPDCMHENIVRACRFLSSQISDTLSDLAADWLELNETIYIGEMDPMEEFWNELKNDAYK